MFEKRTVEQSALDLKTDIQSGLTEQEAERRLSAQGANELVEKKQKTKLQMFLAQLNEPMIYILFAAAVISIFLKEYSDAVIVLIVILLNAVIGVVQEGKAQQALAALKKLSSPTALVKRNGIPVEIPASQLVPGDLVILEAGRQIPADLRLTFTSNLKIEESALTGESVPVEKDASFIADKELPVGDKVNMAFMTTNVTYGRGEGVVAATGMKTEIGRIAKMINETGDETTPLQKRLADLGKLLGVIAVVLCVLLFGIAVIQKRDIAEMLITAISLAVAAVPEGLPAVVTIVLALGVQRLVKVNTIVRRLPSVETLGSVSVVCSDKTGTLTQNKMTVVKCFANHSFFGTDSSDIVSDPLFLEGFILCNDASVENNQEIGDPTEIALLNMGLPHHITKNGLEAALPRIDEMAFDSSRKMMTTLHQNGNEKISFTKGAADQIVLRCTAVWNNGSQTAITEADKKEILDAVHEMSGQALRVLALAVKRNCDTVSEEGLTFIGLVGMIDPPRPEAKDAVAIFKDAQVKTVMITGDHIDTAFAVAKDLSIAASMEECITGEDLDRMSEQELASRIDHLSVFARVSPENKVTIVNALRSKGYIVSMTGDGVNDAPSLKAADIGVAMGITGTDVAKSAADMVLTDDNFATIEKAIAEGRGIYLNIKKSVLFLLSSNFGEIIAMFVSILSGLAAPLKAIHILWVNLITDSLPGLALGVDKNDRSSMMKNPPRDPKESLFAHGGLPLTLFYGALIALITLAAFVWVPVFSLIQNASDVTFSAVRDLLGSGTVLIKAQTYAFTVLGLSQLFHAVGMRNINRSIFRMNHLNNKMMLVAFVVGFVLQIAVTEIPFLISAFGTSQLHFKEWLFLTLISSLPLWAHEIRVLFRFLLKRGGK